MASNFRRLKRAGIHIIPRVLLEIIWSLILHLLLLIIIILFFLLLLAFTIPESKSLRKPLEKLSEESDSLESENPEALDFELDRASLRNLLRLIGAAINAAVAAFSVSSSTFNQISSESSSSSSL